MIDRLNFFLFPATPGRSCSQWLSHIMCETIVPSSLPTPTSQHFPLATVRDRSIDRSYIGPTNPCHTCAMPCPLSYSAHRSPIVVILLIHSVMYLFVVQVARGYGTYPGDVTFAGAEVPRYV